MGLGDPRRLGLLPLGPFIEPQVDMNDGVIDTEALDQVPEVKNLNALEKTLQHHRDWYFQENQPFEAFQKGRSLCILQLSQHGHVI